MKFKTPYCPECGKPADDITEMITGLANLEFDEETGTHEYAGNTDVDWDSQVPSAIKGSLDEKEADKVSLHCPGGHQWDSHVLADPDDPGATFVTAKFAVDRNITLRKEDQDGPPTFDEEE